MEINIAYGADEKYSEYAYISILSILRNTKSFNHINCFLFTTQNNKRIKIIKNLEYIFTNFQLKTIIINDNNIKDFPVSPDLKYITYHTYYRFFIDKIDKIKKIIYLDSDTLIIGDIIELFEENLYNKVIGVISEIPIKLTITHTSTLSLKNNKYFNAGVILIDLEKRKKYNISKKNFYLLKKKKFPYNDQDSLNITTEDKCTYLNGKYNVLTQFFDINQSNFCNIGFDIDYYKNATKKPLILHYTLDTKPRHLLNNHPYRWEYDKTRRFAIYINIIHGKAFPITIKNFSILLLHTIEHLLFPKHSTKKRIRKFANNVLSAIHKLL